MLRSRFAALALLLTLVGSPTMAVAQDEASRAQAREQFGLGVQRYEALDYQGALEAFQEAYRLAPHPTVRVNMANCYEHLGRPLEALHHFGRFLAESEGASRQQRREIESAIRRLEGQIGEVRLSVAPDGALVTIDSAETRRAPLLEPVRLTAGTHHVEVRLEGYRTQRRELQVVGGQAARVAIALERGTDPPAAGVTAADPSTDRAVSAADDPTTDDDVEVTVPELTGGSDFQLRASTPMIISGSAAAVLTVAAVVAGVIALGANDAFEGAVLRSNDPSLPQAERELARLDGFSFADTAQTASIVTDLFIVGAIATAGLTAFLLVVEGMDGGAEEEPRASRPRLLAAPSVGSDGGGLVLQGRF